MGQVVLNQTVPDTAFLHLRIVVAALPELPVVVAAVVNSLAAQCP